MFQRLVLKKQRAFSHRPADQGLSTLPSCSTPHPQALHLHHPPSWTLCATCPFIAALCALPPGHLLLSFTSQLRRASLEASPHHSRSTEPLFWRCPYTPTLAMYYPCRNCFFMPLSLPLSGELRNSRKPSSAGFCTPSRLHPDSLASSRPSNLCSRDEPTSSAGKPNAPSQQWGTSRTISMTCKLRTEFHFPVYRIQNLWTSMSPIHTELQTQVCSCY